MKRENPKDRIKMVSKLYREFSTRFEVGGVAYNVITELERNSVSTRIYEGGRVVMTASEQCDKGILQSASEEQIQELLLTHHRKVLNSFKSERLREIKTPSDYLKEVKCLLSLKNHQDAIALLAEGLRYHPVDPFLMSYHGCLDAIVMGRQKEGVGACLRAIKLLKEQLPFGEEFFYPSFFLNLGRAYIAGGNKRSAFSAFKKGLKVDGNNSDIIWELNKLGVRKPQPVAFLARSNPINKYIGLILHKLRD